MIRFIGDVHGSPKNGKWDSYLDLIDDIPNSVQIGDLGFAYYFLQDEKIDSDKHKFFGGNHDNYDLIFKSPHSLDDFGMVTLGDVDFYYVRGAFSVDHWWRVPMVNIWPNEELSIGQFETAQRDYENAKPDLMVTHDCPNVVRDKILSDGGGIGYGKIKTTTGQGLQNMLDSHRPAVWIFGHWHMDLKFEIDGVEFIGLKELGHIDIGI